MKTKPSHPMIAGPAGQIELRVNAPKADNSAKLVVLSHPHSLYGGSMNNKVVTTMERAFAALGYTTVAYNFRGVGNSEGDYDNGEGEQQDLLTVLDWASEQFQPQKTVLAGFSFGSYVTLKVVTRLSRVDAICTVAPPVGLYDFSGLGEIEPDWVMIQGGQDEVVSPREIMDWALSLNKTPDIYWRSQASHFFHGELVWLKGLIQSVFD